MHTIDGIASRPRRSAWWSSLLVFACFALLFSPAAHAVTGELDMTGSLVGVLAVSIFVLAYALVMGEEKLHMRKSKP
ncbi:hypothetical protein DER72_1491, partial [Halomonas sp. A11-A]